MKMDMPQPGFGQYSHNQKEIAILLDNNTIESHISDGFPSHKSGRV